MKNLKKPLLFLALLLATWLAGFAWYAETALMETPVSPDQTTDAIIVLTGGQNRITTGLELLKSGAAPKLLISGVHKNYTPAHILNQWEGDPAIAECCITLDYKATTTTGNAQETRKWVKENHITSARIVTSKYHMRRALMELQAENPELVLYPYPVMEGDIGKKDLYFWEVTLSEYHKTIWRRMVLTLQHLKQSLS